MDKKMFLVRVACGACVSVCVCASLSISEWLRVVQMTSRVHLCLYSEV